MNIPYPVQFIGLDNGEYLRLMTDVPTGLSVTTALNELRIAILESIVLEHIPKSNLLTVCKVLTNKIHRHCDVAERLLWEASYSEALMILRSAFESALTMNYLALHPDEVIDYEYFALLVSYKDMQLWVKYGFLSPDFEAPENGKPLEKKLEETKQQLLQAKAHEKYKIPEDKLDDIDYLARQIKGNFIDIYKIINTLKDADPQVFVSLSEEAFMIYNEGSKNMHPNWFSACEFFEKPTGTFLPTSFSYSMGIRNILYILLLTVWGLNKIGGIKDMVQLKSHFDRLTKCLQALDADEVQIED